jgi:hypothetical protein
VTRSLEQFTGDAKHLDVLVDRRRGGFGLREL